MLSWSVDFRYEESSSALPVHQIHKDRNQTKQYDHNERAKHRAGCWKSRILVAVGRAVGAVAFL